MPTTYQGQLENGYAPVAGYSNSNPSIPTGMTNVPSATPTVPANVPIIPGQTETVTRYDGQGKPYQVQVPKGFYSGNNVSTTTMSTANKINQVPKIVNQTNQYANTGITTNPTTGQAQYANGEIYNPPQPTQPTNPTQNSGISNGGFVGDVYYPMGAPLPKDSSGNYATTTENSPTDQKIMDSLNAMKAQSDALTASTISAIQAQYANLISQQERANQSQNKSINNALLMAGSSKYAPISSAGIVQAQVSYGIQQIADLTSKENQAIIAAQQAGQAQNFKIMEQINQEIATIRDQKVAAATKLSEKLAEQNAKLAEQERLSMIDSSIADVYSSGVTDVAQIMKTLKSQGLSVSSKDVSEALKNLVPAGLDDLVKTLRNNGAPQDVIQKVLSSGSINDAYKNAGSWGAGGSGIIGEYNFYKAQAESLGQVPVDFNTYQNMDANRKRSIAAAGIAGDNGLTPKQTQNFLAITNKFQADPFINNAIKGQTAVAIANQVINNPDSASNQLKSLYVLVKNLDPDSAVREGEISLAEKTQSYLQNFKSSLTRISKGQVISPTAAKELAEATKELATTWSDTAKRRETQYKAQAAGTGIANAFDEYLNTSNLGYNQANDLVQNEETAKQKIISYGKTNTTFQPIIAKKMTQINPVTGNKYTYLDLLELYPEIK